MTEKESIAQVADPAYIEALYAEWCDNPQQVSESWQAFFRGFEFGRDLPPGGETGKEGAGGAHAQSQVASLIYAYRSQGHLRAHINPLAEPPAEDHPALALASFGLGEAQLHQVFDTGHLGDRPRLPLRDILTILEETYCGSLGAEYVHIQDRGVRRWLQQEMEPRRNQANFSRDRRRAILESLMDAELFERFTHARYPGQKRFSLEGAESLIPALQAVIDSAPAVGISEIVLGMAHRGRLNVLANTVGMSYEAIFSAFEGNFLPESVQGDGDVKYHRGYSATRQARGGEHVHISLTANPSHLEAVCPVVEGRVRAKQRQHRDTEDRGSVLPLLIHGDAAFAGQGVVAETLNLSQLKGYRTGGTLHVVVNNQIGFTSSPEETRSSVYSTDVAKMIEAPIFHVNGDDPEAVVYTVELALRFRQRFARDVVVDLVCYRRHGHNEGDDPAFTQPLVYSHIHQRPSVRALYADHLLEEGDISAEEAETIAEAFRDVLRAAHERAKRDSKAVEVQAFQQYWEGLEAPFSFARVNTGVAHELLLEVTDALCTVPDGFELNAKIGRALPKRREAVRERKRVDWATAEALAFGTLLREGTPVRLSGQDSARGTFSQRHSIWHDAKRGVRHIPLGAIHPDQARFCVYNSTLSEAAVLGFEYGYAVTEPHMLILWEAQFGDFANGAQVIIDQFIAGSESKWQRDSGIVLLLPHGYEGQGPEHSNAYLERFLAACAEDNLQVCYPSTPAQYFHMLRRQVRRNFRLPLVVMTPKSLLRHRRCVSSVDDLTSGGFEEILDDPSPPARARRVLLCAGKVFYDLEERRREAHVEDVAIIRLEQLYPFHETCLESVLGREHLRDCEELLWVQEEPQNRGGWNFMLPRLLRIGQDRRLGYVGRAASASPATGSLRLHRQEQACLVESALKAPLAQLDGAPSGIICNEWPSGAKRIVQGAPAAAFEGATE